MNPAEIRALAANYSPVNVPEPTQPKKGRGGFWGALSPFLPALGAAAGIGLAPLTGGSSLALLGLGAAGGAAGKIGANKLQGKGAFDNPGSIALEGLFGGAGGGLTALKAARAAKSAKTAASATKAVGAERAAVTAAPGAERAAVTAAPGAERAAVTAAPKGNIRTKIANSLTAKGSGLKVGKNVGGASDLDETSTTLQRLKISGTPKQQLHAIEANMSKLGGEADALLTKEPIPVNGKNVRAQVAAALDDPNKYVELDLTTPGATKYLDMHLAKFEGAKSAKEINDYIKVINPVAVRAKDKLVRGVALTDKETAALAAKKAGDEVLSVIPELEPIKKDMAVLFSRNAEIAAQHGKAANIPFVGGILKAPASAARYAQSKAGQVLAGEGMATAGAADDVIAGGVRGNIGNFVKPAIRQSVISGVGNAVLNPEKEDPDAPGMLTAEEAQAREAKIAENILISMTPEERMQLSAQGDEPGAAGGAFTYDQLQAAVAADPKNATTYFGLFDRSEKAKAAGTTKGGKPMSAEASKVTSNAQAGLEAISDLRGTIGSDPGAVKRTLVPGRGLFGGLVGNAVGTNEFEAAREQVVDVIARLRTGANITINEEKRFLKFLPQPFDSPTVREQKLGYLERQFQRIASRNPQAATDIEAALDNQAAMAGAQ